ARSLWDATKLLDLPPEVKDAPWIAQKVDCPFCQSGQFSMAGPAECSECRNEFVIGSCAKCRKVQSLTEIDIDGLRLDCMECGALSEGTVVVRNWPPIILAKAVAEGLAIVARSADTMAVDPSAYRQAVKKLRDFSPKTTEWLVA